jgi:1L-myo-inositol 1-phosphate cytidylyltransferase
MGDHLFEPSVLQRLAALPVAENDSILAIDGSETDPLIAAEATKVQLRGDRVVAIGKDLPHWDALDTGLFIFTPALFDALEQAGRDGETTLSAGVQRLARRGGMRGVDIGAAAWCDVDTLDDLQVAESLFGAVEAEHA